MARQTSTATPAAPAETDAAKRKREAKEKALAEMTLATEENAEVNRLLARGIELDKEKDALFERIASVRDLLRNYAKLGDMNSEQADSYLDLYPPREVKRGNGES